MKDSIISRTLLVSSIVLFYGVIVWSVVKYLYVIEYVMRISSQWS